MNKKIITVGSLICLILCASNSRSAPVTSLPDSDFIKRPSGVCTYEGIPAGCNQLLVTLYRNDGKWLFMKELAKLVKEEGGVIVGQIMELGVLQVEVGLGENLLRLKQRIEKSGYAKSVSFNVESTFN